MFVIGKDRSIGATSFYSGKVVELGKKWLSSGKSVCIRVKNVVIRQKGIVFGQK